MFEVVRALGAGWVIVIAMASCAFIISDFDRARRADWFALTLMLPPIVWSVWLAAADLWRVAGGLPAGIWAWMAGL